MRSSVKVLIALALAGIASSGFARDPDEPLPSDLKDVKINGISYGGTGCKQGSVGQLLASDKQSFTLLFDDYVAEIGPGVSRRESRKFCQVSINLYVPQGYSYTVGSFDYRGWADLGRRVSATQTSKYYFDNAREGSFHTTLRGEYNDDFLLSDDIGLDAVVWSKCGENRLLNIKTELSLDSSDRSAAGVIGLDSLDGKIEQKFGFKWKRCR